ncbi:MAG: HAD family hydrolase [Calditrichaeota bacterium]|nr:MAG: HAD family hydrolase [Calditrichota bacterium]
MFDKNDFTKYAHLIWDWNGTLINDVSMNIQIMNEHLQRESLPELTPKRHQEIFGFPLLDFYKTLGFNWTESSFDEVSMEFMQEYEARKHACELHPACRDFLYHWEREGKQQSVLSAYKQAYLDDSLQRFQIQHLFQFVVGAENHRGDGKIAEGKRLLQDIGQPPEKIALIGDTIHDFEVAEAIGIDCFLVTSGNQSMQRLQDTSAKIIILDNVQL